MVPPRPRHGENCGQVVYLLRRRFLDDNPFGRVVGNHAGIITERDPDTVRGPDIAHYSFERVPKGPLPAGLLGQSPELVLEVRLPSDRWSDLHAKMGEYLQAGVRTACVVHDDTRTVHVVHTFQEPQIRAAGDEFRVPQLLSNLSVNVARFFE